MRPFVFIFVLISSVYVDALHPDYQAGGLELSDVEIAYEQDTRVDKPKTVVSAVWHDQKRDIDDQNGVSIILRPHIEDEQTCVAFFVCVPPAKERAGQFQLHLHSLGFNRKEYPKNSKWRIPVAWSDKGLATEEGQPQKDGAKSFEKQTFWTQPNHPAIGEYNAKKNFGQTEYFGHIVDPKKLDEIVTARYLFEKIYRDAEEENQYINIAVLTTGGDLWDCIEYFQNNEEMKRLIRERTMHISIQGEAKIDTKDGVEKPTQGPANNDFNYPAMANLYQYMNDNGIAHTTMTKGMALNSQIVFKNLEAIGKNRIEKTKWVPVKDLIKDLMPSEIGLWLGRYQMYARFMEDPMINRVYNFGANVAAKILLKHVDVFEALVRTGYSPTRIIDIFTDLREGRWKELESKNPAEVLQKFDHIKPGWPTNLMYDGFPSANTIYSFRETYRRDYMGDGIRAMVGIAGVEYALDPTEYPTGQYSGSILPKFEQMLGKMAKEMEHWLYDFNMERRAAFKENPCRPKRGTEPIDVWDRKYTRAFDNIDNQGKFHKGYADRMYCVQYEPPGLHRLDYVSRGIPGGPKIYASPFEYDVQHLAFVSDDEYPNGAQYVYVWSKKQFLVYSWISSDRQKVLYSNTGLNTLDCEAGRAFYYQDLNPAIWLKEKELNPDGTPMKWQNGVDVEPLSFEEYEHFNEYVGSNPRSQKLHPYLRYADEKEAKEKEWSLLPSKTYGASDTD